MIDAGLARAVENIEHFLAGKPRDVVVPPGRRQTEPGSRRGDRNPAAWSARGQIASAIAVIASGFSSDDTSPAGCPRCVARITRRMILALRVFGRSRAKSTFSGLSALPTPAATRFDSSARSGSDGAWPGPEHDEADDGLALDLVGHADDAGLGDGGMADQHRLDLGRPEPLAGDLQRVVRAALDEPEAVVVDVRPVAVDPDVGPARPVRLLVALRVAPEPRGHARPRLA